MICKRGAHVAADVRAAQLANAIKKVAPASAGPVQNAQGLAAVISDLRKVVNNLVSLRGGASGVRSQVTATRRALWGRSLVSAA